MNNLHIDGYAFLRKWLFPYPPLLVRDIREGMAAGKQEFTVRDTCGLAKRILQMFPTHRYGGAVFRLTPATCQMMDPHCEFELSHRLVEAPDDKIPLTMLVALDDYVAVDLWPGSHRDIRKTRQEDMPRIEEYQARLFLYEGDAIVMRGDLVHGGVRGNNHKQCVLMIYIDYPDFPRDRLDSFVLYREPNGDMRAAMMQNKPMLRN
jgi:hypothetical protein